MKKTTTIHEVMDEEGNVIERTTTVTEEDTTPAWSPIPYTTNPPYTGPYAPPTPPTPHDTYKPWVFPGSTWTVELLPKQVRGFINEVRSFRSIFTG